MKVKRSKKLAWNPTLQKTNIKTLNPSSPTERGDNEMEDNDVSLKQRQLNRSKSLWEVMQPWIKDVKSEGKLWQTHSLLPLRDITLMTRSQNSQSRFFPKVVMTKRPGRLSTKDLYALNGGAEKDKSQRKSTLISTEDW